MHEFLEVVPQPVGLVEEVVKLVVGRQKGFPPRRHLRRGSRSGSLLGRRRRGGGRAAAATTTAVVLVGVGRAGTRVAVSATAVVLAGTAVSVTPAGSRGRHPVVVPAPGRGGDYARGAAGTAIGDGAIVRVSGLVPTVVLARDRGLLAGKVAFVASAAADVADGRVARVDQTVGVVAGWDASLGPGWRFAALRLLSRQVLVEGGGLYRQLMRV